MPGETEQALAELDNLEVAIQNLARVSRGAEELARGLKAALNVIANYRLDAREISETGVRPGYCQGSWYMDAYRLIHKAMKEGM